LISSFSKLKSIDHCAEWYANLIDTYTEGIRNRTFTIDSKYMQSILQYIDRDIVNVTLNSVADKFKISTSHLSRVFKKHVGRNFLEYVTEKRLEHACNLIATTDMKISDIVSAMGCQNINYFIKTFKFQYNLTPAQYRKQYHV
jgi:two-component system response regulator YesN